MVYKNTFIIILLLIAVACVDKDCDVNEHWKVSTWTAVSMCTFPNYEKENPIVEVLLGLEDTIYLSTELLLQNNGNFAVTKNKTMALTGEWHYDRQKLHLNTINDQFSFEVVCNWEDSLLLRSEVTITMADLYVTLKR